MSGNRTFYKYPPYHSVKESLEQLWRAKHAQSQAWSSRVGKAWSRVTAKFGEISSAACLFHGSPCCALAADSENLLHNYMNGTSSYLRLEQARDSWRKYFISTIWKLRWFQTSMCLRRILKKFPFMCHFFMILFLFWSGVLESSSSSEESSVARDSTLGGAFCYSPCGCVLCSRDYDVFEKEYMFKSCTICLL